jgi:hypothetical protein
VVKRIIGDDMYRLISKTDKGPHPDGCWYFTGAIGSHGYGNIWFQGKYTSTQRMCYKIFCGEIPENMHVDHLCHTRENCSGVVKCRHRKCIRPSHLTLATHRDNLLRGNGGGGDNIRKTHCSRGHLFTPETTYVRPGVKPGNSSRDCRICRSDASRKSIARKNMRDG